MKDKKYLEWIRTKQCSHCFSQVSATEAHHLSGDLHQGGVAMKASDLLAMPLCFECHTAFHNTNRKIWDTKQERFEDQRYWLLRTLIMAMEEEVLVLGEIPDLPW